MNPRHLVTTRLTLRPLVPDDAAFVLELLNTPGWLRFIGDRNLRSEADARRYIVEGPWTLRAAEGFGMWRVALRAGDVPVGLCGLLKRDTLPHADLGFALLPAHYGQGYAAEASRALMGHGRSALGLPRLLAITSPDNESSGRLLEKLGFKLEGTTRLSHSTEELKLYAVALE